MTLCPVDFICNFELSWYPFDTQHCYINISLEGNSKNFVNLGRFLYRCWKLFFRQRGQINNKKNKPAPGNAHYQGPIDLAHYYIKVRNNRSRCVIFLFRITALSKEMERSVWSSVWEDDFSVRAWPSTFQPSCSTLLHLPPTISRWLFLSYSISLLLPPTNSRWLTFIYFI